MHFKGQFAGISEVARNEKLRLFLNLIEEHKIVGIASAIPHYIFFLYSVLIRISSSEIPTSFHFME